MEDKIFGKSLYDIFEKDIQQELVDKNKYIDDKAKVIFTATDPAWKDAECTVKFHYEWETLVVDEFITKE